MENVGLFYLGDPSSLSQERVQLGIDFLRRHDLEIFNQDIITSELSAQQKAENFNNLYRNPRVDIMMSFWGGRDTNASLNYIDYDYIKNNPKPIVGYSDTSAILLAVNKLTALNTFYGPSFVSFTKGFGEDFCVKSLLATLRRETLFWKPDKINLDAKCYLNNRLEIESNRCMKVFKHGQVQGVGVVSCISTLSALIGTSYFPDFENKILFLEQSDTSRFSGLKRYMAQFDQTGCFDNISGLVFSKFASNGGITEHNLLDMLDLYFGHREIPIIYNLDFGHTDPISTLTIGRQYRLDTNNLTLEYV